MHIKKCWRGQAGLSGKPIHGIAFVQGPGGTSWVIWDDEKIQSVPPGDLILGENSQRSELYDANSIR